MSDAPATREDSWLRSPCSSCGDSPCCTHLPVARWVEPHEFARWKQIGEGLGVGHVEASPLARSSYHARQSADHVTAIR